MDVPNVKSSVEKKRELRDTSIRSDIQRIDELVSTQSNETTELENLHREIENKYRSIIPRWGESMWCYNKEYGFDYNFLSKSANDLKDNLRCMKYALEGFLLMDNTHQKDVPNSEVNVVVNNSVEVVLTFNDMRQKVEDMTALNQEQTDEIIEKINELEAISAESCSKKKKWEKIKPILLFALDKGVEIAMMFLAKVVEMKLQ